MKGSKFGYKGEASVAAIASSNGQNPSSVGVVSVDMSGRVSASYKKSNNVEIDNQNQYKTLLAGFIAGFAMRDKTVAALKKKIDAKENNFLSRLILDSQYRSEVFSQGYAEDVYKTVVDLINKNKMGTIMSVFLKSNINQTDVSDIPAPNLSDVIGESTLPSDGSVTAEFAISESIGTNNELNNDIQLLKDYSGIDMTDNMNTILKDVARIMNSENYDNLEEKIGIPLDDFVQDVFERMPQKGIELTTAEIESLHNDKMSKCVSIRC